MMGPKPPPRFVAWLRDQISDLFPGYFALVMATGIISNTIGPPVEWMLEQFMRRADWVAG